MRHKTIFALIAGAMVVLPTAASADGGYFSQGEKRLVVKKDGERTSPQKTTLYSLVGATVLTGAIGTFYLLDSQSISNELSASGLHTLKTWDRELEDSRLDGVRSSKIATVTLGMSGAFAAATIVTYIITQPDSTIAYQDWQTKNMPSLAPTRGGLVMSQGWSF
jgi:hypothetical protein